MSIFQDTFGFDVNCKDDLKLSLPTMHEYKQFRAQYVYKNKEFFWDNIKPIVNYLSEFKSVAWSGDSDLAIHAHTATRVLREKKGAATKEYMADFYCMFYGCDSNVLLLADCLMTREGYDVAQMIAVRGAMCMSELPDIMNWPKYKASYWGSNSDKSTFERWAESKDTATVAMMCYILNGSAPQHHSRSSYYVPIYPYIMPDYKLLQFVGGKMYGALSPQEIADPSREGLTLFQGDDLFGNENTLQSMILSGVLAAGKSKVGVATAKKLGNYIPLKPFPGNGRTILSRNEYVANAAFLVFGEPSDMELPGNPLPDKKYLMMMYENIQINCRYYLMQILSGSVRGVVQEFFYVNRNKVNALSLSIVRALAEGCKILDGGWMDYESFCGNADYRMALDKCNYLYPDDYSQRPENVKDGDGNPLAISDFKAHFHDIVQRAVIEGLAAIGGVDLLYDDSGIIRWIRLSEAGKWYVGLSSEMPQPKAIVDVESALEVDDQTGLILVKDPAYPYTGLLAEFADKMTDTRYCLSEKVFLRKCDTPEMLEAKIKRFKMFILPKPGPHVSSVLSRMMADCNLVKKAPGGSTFQLFDIDPKNSRLHNIIVDDKEIRRNTLRVEGCKLLVKTKFVARFLEILASHGFLNSI